MTITPAVIQPSNTVGTTITTNRTIIMIHFCRGTRRG